MSGSVNKAIIIGNLGRDPEVRSFANGGRVCNLSVATSETWKDKQSGERKERTEWHRVTIMSDGLVGIAERYLSKGSKVYIEGQIETRKWTDQQGVEKFSTEIVLRQFGGVLTLLDAPKGEREERRDEGPSGGRSNPGKSNPGADLDDEIPFGPEWR